MEPNVLLTAILYTLFVVLCGVIVYHIYDYMKYKEMVDKSILNVSGNVVSTKNDLDKKITSTKGELDKKIGVNETNLKQTNADFLKDKTDLLKQIQDNFNGLQKINTDFSTEKSQIADKISTLQQNTNTLKQQHTKILQELQIYQKFKNETEKNQANNTKDFSAFKKNTIDRLLLLDVSTKKLSENFLTLTKQHQYIVDDISNFKKKFSDSNNALLKDLKLVSNDMTKLTKNLQFSLTEIIDLKKKISILDAERIKMATDINILKDFKIQQTTLLQTSISQLNAKDLQFQKNITDIQTYYRALSGSITKLNTETQGLRNTDNTINTKIAQLIIDLNSLKRQQDAMTKDLGIIKLLTTDTIKPTDIQGVSSVISVLNAKNDGILKDIDDIKRFIETLKATQNVSPVSITQIQPKIDSLSSSNLIIREDIKKLTASITALTQSTTNSFNNLEGSLNKFFSFKDGSDTNIAPNKKMYERVFGGTKPDLSLISQVTSLSGMTIKTQNSMIDDKNFKICNQTNNCMNFNTNDNGFNMTPNNVNSFTINSKNMTALGKFDLTNDNVYIKGKIGVGKAVPEHSLDVVGNINCTGAFKVNGVNIGNVGTTGTTGTQNGNNIVGIMSVSAGNPFANKLYMQSGSLTIGDINLNYGNGNNWNNNTAGLMLECKDNTEIAVHDSGTRIISLMSFKGDNENTIEIGRNMAWGVPKNVIINATNIFTRGKMVVNDSIDGTNTRGIMFWNSGDTNWGIYMGSSGDGKSFNNGKACDGVNFGLHAIRIRTSNDAKQGLIYENNAEQCLFSVRGSDGMTYHKGNVGIGVANPSQALEVVANSYYMANFKHSNGTQGISIGYNEIGASGTNVNQDLIIKPKGTGTMNVSGKIVVNQSIDGTNTRGIMFWNSGDTNWGIYMGSSGAGKSFNNGKACDGVNFGLHAIRIRTTKDERQGLIYENNAEQCLFSVRGSDGMTYHKGNVGIGKANPAYMLDVNGDVNCTGTFKVNGVNINNTNNVIKKLEVQGIANIHAGKPYAVVNNFMSPGSLTIGDIGMNYGNGTNGWTTNSAGLLLECLDNTDIAVHDSIERVVSFMSYEGKTTNRFQIGKNMGWGGIGITTIWGNVGIGSITPSQKLHVVGNIYLSGDVTKASDIRIKTNIQDIKYKDALQQILSIQPKKYEYIDKETNGSNVIFGFIAQDVKEIVHEAVQLKDEFIPNIFKEATYQNDVISFNCDIDTTILSSNMEIRVKTTISNEYNVYTIKGFSSNQIILDKDIINKNDIYNDENKCFVYGTNVKDFHTIDNSYIYTLNVSATQELHNIISKQDETIKELKERMTYLEDIILRNNLK